MIVIVTAIFYILGGNMEKRTFYIHKTKNEPKSYTLNNEHRVVNFIGGNQDIIEIIKKLIKNQHNS